MTAGNNDDASRGREDAFLAGLVPQAAEHLAEQHAADFDAMAGRARFLSWLVRHTEEPGIPAGAKIHARRPGRRTGTSPGRTTYAGGSSGPARVRQMAVYLGLVEEDQYASDSYEEYEEYGQADPLGEAVEDEARTGQMPQTTGLTHITTLHPRTYSEARTVGEHFRDGTAVIMNLTEMADSDAGRIVDFAAGLVFGLGGAMDRVTNKVFLLSPANVEVSAEDKARIAEQGFFNQS